MKTYPVQIAVIFDQVLHTGGGYQQALNVAISINNSKINKYYRPVFFTIYAENVELLKNYGIDAIFIKISKFGRAWLKVRSMINSRRVLNYVQKFIGLNKFESKLVQNNIDIVYFISPSSWSVYLEKLNYITTVWDLCHRDAQEFPEVYSDRIFEQREDMYKKTLTKAVAVISDSELGKNNIIRRYLVDESRVHILPFSPAITIVDNNKNDFSILKKKFEILNDYIFYPAQYWAHKNHAYILQGIKALKDKYNIELDVVFSGGDSGNLDYIKNIVHTLDLSKQVHFLGFVDNNDIVSLYKNSLALVMPTYFGPTNIPPIEAFVLGVPVLYSDLPGLNDQVKGAALLLDLKNPESMANHLYRLINDPSLREELIQSGRDKIDTNTSNLHSEIIESICADFQVRMYCWKNGGVL